MGAAEDGRAPTEELSCLRSRNFCSMTLGENRTLEASVFPKKRGKFLLTVFPGEL